MLAFSIRRIRASFSLWSFALAAPNRKPSDPLLRGEGDVIGVLRGELPGSRLGVRELLLTGLRKSLSLDKKVLVFRDEEGFS